MYGVLRSIRRQGMLAARRSHAWGSAVGSSCGHGDDCRERYDHLERSDHNRDLASQSAGARETEQSSVNRAEADKFAKLAPSWWDPSGPFKPLHALNKARCEFIKGVVDDYIRESGPLTKLRILDVGCGGGILSESLATMNFRDRGGDVGPDSDADHDGGLDVRVLGIDVNQEGIDAATAHRDVEHPSISKLRLTYEAAAIEDLLERRSFEPFDITISSEVIEHVDHPSAFCRNLIRATAPGGRIVISTLNRTVKSYGLAIVAAETLLRMVPEGTHDWSKFLTPEEVILMMTSGGVPGKPDAEVALDSMAGMVLNPLTGLWKLDGDDVDVNYIQAFRKR